MFIHIGDNKVVLTKDVIMIMDKSAINAKDTVDFLQISKEEGFISDEDWKVDLADRKSAILLDKEIVFSPISSTTLLKRASFVKGL